MIRVLILCLTILYLNPTFSGAFERVFYFESGMDTISGRKEKSKFKNFNYLFQKFKIDSVFITGFADKDGNRKSNLALSKKRAKNLLTNLSIPEDAFVKLNWKGDEFEDYENDSINKYKNRKVVIKIIHSGKRVKTFYYNGKAVKKGDKLDLPTVNFVPGRAILLPGSELALNEMVQIMKTNPTLHFLVEGHVCCQHEVELSENRAKMVYQFLIDKGIDKTRLKYIGFGIAKLKYSINDKRNRRVELVVIKI